MMTRRQKIKSANEWRNECEQKIVNRSPIRFSGEGATLQPFVTMTVRLFHFLLVLALVPATGHAQDGKPTPTPEPISTITIEKTPGGVEFGIWGEISEKPAPLLFVLSGTINSTLSSAYFRQCGNELVAEHGFLLVSIDIPCHGSQGGDVKPNGLSGWASRAADGDDFVAENNARMSEVLDHLIETGVADPKMVAACGTSRGGFLALHFAAHDKRVECAAGFAPVTDPAALSEFGGLEGDAFVKSLDLESRAAQLAGRPLWVVIGDQDSRVSTARVIAFAQAVTRASIEQKVDSRIDLHVIAEPRGHSTPHGSAELAAKWIHRQMFASAK
jgi:dienelactone hydrolase